jgi:sugar porter (SP) family MFS transporter
MYIAELAPKRIRGGMVSFNQLAIVTGILIAYIVNFALKGAPSEWRWMLGLGAIPGLILAIGMVALPESPRWLVKRGREDEARDVLDRARVGDVDEEMGEIKEVVQKEGSLRDILADAVRPMLVIGLALAVFQQLIGINTVIYYAPTILKSAGVATSGAIQQTVFIGLTNLVFTILAVLLLDRLGRRALLLTGTAGCVVALIALGAYFASPTLQSSAGWLALTSLIVYIASFAIGLGPVFWLMISEIFPLHLRGPAMAACTVANWAFNFAISFTFLTLTHAITKQGTFWLYAGLGVIALWFFATRVPETRGRTLEEIEEDALDTTQRDERFESTPGRVKQA